MQLNRAARTLVLSLLVVLAAMLLAGCGGSDESSGDGGGSDTSSEEEADSEGGGGVSEDVAARNDSYDAPPAKKLDPKQQYVVRVTTNKGAFDIDVDPRAAPIAAANFVFLVEEGYYDGVPFHRIIKDFMVQTGDPTGTGTGGPGYALKDDPVKGTYTRGTVAMANAGPDTGGSQFFIVHGTTVDQTLSKDYVIFGKVDEQGMETVDAIAETPVEMGPSGEESTPTEDVVIESAKLVE